MEMPKTKYDYAKARIQEIKDWYSHLGVYLVINVILQLFLGGYFNNEHIHIEVPEFARYTTPIIWGMILILHGLWVFRGKQIRRFYKNWEDRKLNQFMQEETDDFKRNRWD